MSKWWYDNIVEPAKLPLLLCLLAFVATFLLTRVITRLILHRQAVYQAHEGASRSR